MKQNKRNMLAPIAACLTVGAISSVNAVVLVDDFSAGLAAWDSTVILNNGAPNSNTTTFLVNGAGALEVNTSVFSGIEQIAYIRGGAILDVGEEVQLDVTAQTSGSRNFGLYVGGSAPVTGGINGVTRADFISVYTQDNNTRVFSRGFDGSTEFGLNNSPFAPDLETLFVARTGANTFETGYYENGVRNVNATRTPVTPNSADFVGIYADVRGTGILEQTTEFRIVSTIPEPSTALLGALGALGLMRRRR